MISHGLAVLDTVARRQRRQLTNRRVGWGMAVALVVCGLAARWAPGSEIEAASLSAVGLGILGVLSARARPGDRLAASRTLDRRAPSVEDSATLLLAEPRSPLEALQRLRAADRIAMLDAETLVPIDGSSFPFTALLSAGLVAVWLFIGATKGSAPAAPDSPAAVSRAAPALESLEARVVSPAYLALPDREETATPLGPRVEEGGSVIWTATFADADAVELIVEGGGKPFLRDGDAWRLEHRPTATQIVTLRARGPGGEWISPAARLVVVADEPPSIRIVAPAAITELTAAAASELGRLPVRAEAADDHGLAEIDLVLTLAAGVGEGVSFEEQRRPFAGGTAAAVRREVSSSLDLAALGLAPGSELYLVAEARDRSPRRQLGRSDAVLVRILTEGGDSVGLGRGIVLRNELEALRSQRQILIDTERLVAAAPGLERTDFEQRSHGIGLDQNAIRLRYGELLGQEVADGRVVEGGEGGEGAHAPEEAIGSQPGAFLETGATGIPGDLMHLHDSAESATFFADPVRTQLRAMLDAMWKAELRLRTFEPRAALPFEREALRLLKDLQEKSRRYVPKFGSVLPPFEERRRLTGERAKIRDVTLRLDARADSSTSGLGADNARSALGYWQAASGGGVASPAALRGLARFLESEAARGALTDLSVLDAARRFEATATPHPVDLETVARGLWSLLPEPEAVPRPPPIENAAHGSP